MKIRNEASFLFTFFMLLKYQIRKHVYALQRKSVCVSLLFESIMLMHFPSLSLVFSIHLLTHLLCHKCLQFDLILNVRGNYKLVLGYFLNLPSLKKELFGVEILGCSRRQLN